MNDHELDLALAAIGDARTRVTTSPVLRARVRAVPFETPPPNVWQRLTSGGLGSMFSATKLMIAGVVVALVGAFLVSGILPTSDQTVIPGTEASPLASPEAALDETAAPVAVSGRFGLNAEVDPGEPEVSELSGGGERVVRVWPHIPVEVSDERLDAELVLRETIDEYPQLRYSRIEMRIETPEGAWELEPISTIIDESSEAEYLGDAIWVGEGGYDGLWLIANLEEFGFGFDLEGVIVEASE